jgi:hypothetical protein
VSALPASEGKTAKEGSTDVNANLQQPKRKTAHRLVWTTEDVGGWKPLRGSHDGRGHEIRGIGSDTKQDGGPSGKSAI